MDRKRFHPDRTGTPASWINLVNISGWIDRPISILEKDILNTL